MRNRAGAAFHHLALPAILLMSLPCWEKLRMRALDIVSEKREEVLRLASTYVAYNFRIFGSAARGEDTESSDIDFLVSMEEGRSLLDQAGLVADLESLL